MTDEPRFSTHEEIRDWLKDRVNELRAEYADDMMILQRQAEDYHNELAEASDDDPPLVNEGGDRWQDFGC